MVQEHEFKDGVCKHCGALYPRSECTCNLRDEIVSGLRPEPKLRIMAVDDVDFIFNRIKELKIEDEEMINHVNKE